MHPINFDLPLRMQRLRKTANLRALLRETQLSAQDFIYPLFIKQGITQKKAISSMPGQFQLCLDDLAQEIDLISDLAIPAVLLFGIPDHKDETGQHACDDNGIIQQATHRIKRLNPDLLIITDLCFCEYLNHGHCGLLHNKQLDNDSTLCQLARQAISHAQAGADIIAPSGMMDGMVKAIRSSLDDASFQHIPILSYSVKYASSFYDPFRDAAEGSPQFGDRRTYQMDPANTDEAIREAALDIDEGADMLMVKPAMNYLDIIYRLKQTYPSLPLAAYQVSGEYSMIKYAAQQGLIDEKKAILESLIAIKRAGANMIISYFAKQILSNAWI